MSQVTFSYIFLVLFVSIVHCKKYLIEVEDEKKSGDEYLENININI